jgi:hypothetical protein
VSTKRTFPQRKEAKKQKRRCAKIESSRRFQEENDVIESRSRYCFDQPNIPIYKSGMDFKEAKALGDM